MEKLLHNVEDARKLLSIGRSKFYEEVHAGRLTVVKAGKKTLVPQRSLDSYLEARIAEAVAGSKAVA
ncbi:MAG: helix-turn-helix domain-containing protein [Casimicrobiaceae bacterium]